MKLIISVFTVLALLFSSEVKGQAVDKTFVADGLTESAPQEKIYLHYNSSLVFPGEYFLYSLYNLKGNSGEASDFSKIAYVEMVGDDKELVFRQKIKLENGRGSADFFIPTSTPSGNYKLIAYTNWMKNLKNAFFEGDIVVINPYQSSQRELLKNSEDQDFAEVMTAAISSVEKEQKDVFDLELNKKKFGNRERVHIDIDGRGADALEGRYSLSVRKTGDLPAPARVEPANIITPAKTSPANNNTEKLFLPELRGQLISGRITAETGTTAIENRKVALSIPSYKGFVQIALTNKQGQFFFNLDRELRDEDAVLELIGDESSDLQIILDKNEGIEFENLSFSDYKISPGMEEEIVQRSLYNQVENAYFSVKPDTLSPVQEEVIFPNTLVETYNLDEYTRFKGVPDTFVEIIKSAWVKREQGKQVFEVRGLLGHLPMRLKPLVMVDGLLVQDHSVLVNYDAGRIQTIKIIRDKIYLGPEIYQGAILVETVEGNFSGEYIAPNAERIELNHPEIAKNYFQQVYNSENRDSRVPDYRYQLLWKPALDPNENDGGVEFFTSDVDGKFEVVLEGFTASGKPVSVRKVFSVE